MVLPTAVVIGVGATRGLGAALCRKFSGEGYHVFVVGRSQEKVENVAASIRSSGGSAEARVIDATKEEEVTALFAAIFSESPRYEKPDLVVFNVGNNKRLAFSELSASTFEDFWRVGCFAGFLVGREAIQHLAPLGRGTIIFTGASASLRGKAGFAQFSSAKAGLRMLSQSMAREFGPEGIHVAHVVVDGGINGDRLQNGSPERYASAGTEGLLDPESIAQTYWHIHKQGHSSWTQEIDLRPFKENF